MIGPERVLIGTTDRPPASVIEIGAGARVRMVQALDIASAAGEVAATGAFLSMGPDASVDMTTDAGFLSMLGFLREQDNIRVNCLVPSWIASPAPKAYWESLTPEQRQERGVPETLLSLEELADAVLRLATDETLYGRMMIWWNGEAPRLVAAGDAGYAALESLRGEGGSLA